MPLLAVLVGLFLPRVTIAVVWFFTTWFAGVFGSVLWPLLGFLFAPVSLLWYSVVVNSFDGAWTAPAIIGMVVAVALDLGVIRLGKR